MAQPITWQNVNAPAMGNPAQFMQLAQTGIDAGFDKLGAVLKQRETTDKANWDQGSVNNTEAFKSALYGVNTVDGMKAAQESGQFNNMLTGYGAQVKDPSALRALMEGRMGVLQKQTTDGLDYARTMVDYKDAPNRDEARARIAIGDVKGAQPFIDQLGRDKAPLVEAGQKQILDRVAQLRGIEADTHLKETRPLIIEGLESGLLTAAGQRDKLAAETAELERKTKKENTEKKGATFIREAVKTEFAKFNATDGARSAAIGEVTGSLNLPRLPTGAPDMEAMSPSQRSLLQNTLRTKKLDIPLSTTAVMAKLERMGIDQDLSPDNMQELRKTANALFSSNGGVLSTADQADQANFAKVIDARKLEATKNNMFYNPPEEMAKGKSVVMEKINTGIKDGDYLTKGPIKETISKWMDQGLPVQGKDGKTQYVPIPPKLMEYALSSGMESDTYLTNNTENRVETILRRALQAPEYQANIAEADFLRAGGDEQLKSRKSAVARILGGNDTSAQTLADIAQGGGPVAGAAPMTLPSYSAPKGNAFALPGPNARGIYGNSSSKKKETTAR